MWRQSSKLLPPIKWTAQLCNIVSSMISQMFPLSLKHPWLLKSKVPVLATHCLIVLYVLVISSWLDGEQVEACNSIFSTSLSLLKWTTGMSSAFVYSVDQWYGEKQLKSECRWWRGTQFLGPKGLGALTQVFISIAWCKRIVAREMVLMGVPKVKTSISESL